MDSTGILINPIRYGVFRIVNRMGGGGFRPPKKTMLLVSIDNKTDMEYKVTSQDSDYMKITIIPSIFFSNWLIFAENG